MLKSRVLKVLLYFFAGLAILFVLFVSLSSRALYGMSTEERQERSKIEAKIRVRELLQGPLLPDHPLYVVKMITDRFRLTIAFPENKAGMKITFAHERLGYARLLLDRGRSSLALTTLTKAEKYLLQAAAQARAQYPHASSSQWQNVVLAITTHNQELESMKPQFSDQQRSVIDRLQSELTVAIEQQ